MIITIAENLRGKHISLFADSYPCGLVFEFIFSLRLSVTTLWSSGGGCFLPECFHLYSLALPPWDHVNSNSDSHGGNTTLTNSEERLLVSLLLTVALSLLEYGPPGVTHTKTGFFFGPFAGRQNFFFLAHLSLSLLMV